MTAVQERFTQILPQMQRDYTKMPDSDVQQIINVWVKVKPKEEPEKSHTEKFAEYKAKMKKSQEWAREVGLTPDDITRAIKEVRMEKRQKV